MRISTCVWQAQGAIGQNVQKVREPEGRLTAGNEHGMYREPRLVLQAVPLSQLLYTRSRWRTVIALAVDHGADRSLGYAARLPTCSWAGGDVNCILRSGVGGVPAASNRLRLKEHRLRIVATLSSAIV